MTATVPEDYVYLDWAATAPLCEEAAAAMLPYLTEGVGNVRWDGNANSLHTPGRAAFERLEQARHSMAADLNASRPNEIVFTSGATESDNAALLGIAQAAATSRNLGGPNKPKPRVITTMIEHDAVLKAAQRLEQQGFDVVYLKPTRAGFILPEALEAQMDERTVLVSVQMANSEIGAVQPIKQLTDIAHAGYALMHTDAVQAFGKVPVDVRALGVDAASFAAHKVCGPKGVGALYLKARTPFLTQALGGGQEEGRRSGTQNVCGAAGFAAACHAAVENLEAEAARERALRDELYAFAKSLSGVTPTVEVTPGSEDYLCNIVHLLVEGMESETMVLRLDRLGFGVSGGSACATHSLDPSHVLEAMNVSRDAAYGALRISFGRFTTEADIASFKEALARVISA